MVTEVDGRWTVIGLTSWGYSCAKASAPAMFAKVSSFVYMLDQEDEGEILSKMFVFRLAFVFQMVALHFNQF